MHQRPAQRIALQLRSIYFQKTIDFIPIINTHASCPMLEILCDRSGRPVGFVVGK